MTSHSAIDENDFHERLSLLKGRISNKKIEANLLFSNNELNNNSKLKASLETIRNILVGQQPTDDNKR